MTLGASVERAEGINTIRFAHSVASTSVSNRMSLSCGGVHDRTQFPVETAVDQWHPVDDAARAFIRDRQIFRCVECNGKIINVRG